MNNTYIINSESNIKNDLDRIFKLERIFEQKSLYLDGGANIYYNIKPSAKLYTKGGVDLKKNYKFIKKNFLEKNKKIAFISLGCGNSKSEKYIITKARNEGYDISYFGVDSSMSMIELSKKNLKNSKFPQYFIQADFTSDIFREELEKIIVGYSKKIFSFVGSTLGNVPQSYMADALRNMLKKGEVLWIDVAHIKDTTNTTAGEIFEKYLRRISIPEWKNFLLYPLKSVGIKLGNGELILNMSKENTQDILIMKYDFLINEKTEFEMNNEIITLLPDDIIQLCEMRVYHEKSLEYLFENRKFKLVDKFSLKNRLQIMFVKK